MFCDFHVCVTIFAALATLKGATYVRAKNSSKLEKMLEFYEIYVIFTIFSSLKTW